MLQLLPRLRTGRTRGGTHSLLHSGRSKKKNPILVMFSKEYIPLEQRRGSTPLSAVIEKTFLKPDLLSAVFGTTLLWRIQYAYRSSQYCLQELWCSKSLRNYCNFLSSSKSDLHKNEIVFIRIKVFFTSVRNIIPIRTSFHPFKNQLPLPVIEPVTYLEDQINKNKFSHPEKKF